MKAEIFDILAHSQLFGGLSAAHLGEISAVAAERRLNKGEVIFMDGDEGDGFFLVIEGIIKVYKMSPEGKEQILHIVKAGETIGAVPVFSGLSFPASAQALTRSTVLFFPKKKFTGLITANPSLTMNILAVLSMRLRELTMQIESLSLKELPARLAAYLLFQSEEQGGAERITLDISKSLLSGILGTRPESLSRALGALSDQELIAVDGSDIELTDREGLNELSAWGKLGG